MKRKLIATLLVLGLMLSFVPMTIFSTSAEAADTWVAEGDANGQYYVTTADDLRAFGNAISSGSKFEGKTINILADIDLGTQDIKASEQYDADTGWAIDNDQGKEFKGMIDGHGHTISGLYVSHESVGTTGLFGNKLIPIKNFTVGVKNLTIKNSSVRGTNCLGGLFGWVDVGANDGTDYVVFDNLDLDIDVCGSTSIGGVFGEDRASRTTISNCIIRGDITGSASNVGGVCGLSYNGGTTNVVNTAVSGAITATASCGGIFGLARQNGASTPSATNITGCVFDGTMQVSTASAYAGGFVGKVGAKKDDNNPRPTHVTIEDSAFYGTIHTTVTVNPSHIGGLVGGTDVKDNKITVDRCVISGELTAADTTTIDKVDSRHIRATVAVVSTGNTCNINNVVGMVTGKLADLGEAIIEKAPAGSGTKTVGSNVFYGCYDGKTEIEIPAGHDSVVFTSLTGRTLDLSKTFVPTTSTKPLPMGVVRFYADQMGKDLTGNVTDALGYQTLNSDSTAIRLVGLVKDDGNLAAYDAVGFDIVAIRATGASVKSVPGVASTTKVYTSIVTPSGTKTTATLDGAAGYDYIYTAAVEGIDANGGVVTFVVRSFHEKGGVRTYDDTRVINYDPQNP